MRAEERAELTARRDTLTRRLEDGYSKIERGLADGADKANVTAWEDLWISLLREYERVMDALDAADERRAG